MFIILSLNESIQISSIDYTGVALFYSILFSWVIAYFHFFRIYFVPSTNSGFPRCTVHILTVADIFYILKISSPRNLSQSLLTKSHQLEGMVLPSNSKIIGGFSNGNP